MTPLTAALSVCAVGLLLCFVFWRAAELEDLKSREAAARYVERRIDDYVSTLYSVRALANLTGGLTRDALAKFIESTELKRRLPGMEGIGFARATPSSDLASAAAVIQASYALDRKVWPASSQPMRFPIVMLEPIDARQQRALGYDMLTEPIRRTAMLSAWQTDTAVATDAVVLAQDVHATQESGFLIYLPVFSSMEHNHEIEGFVYAPFRTGKMLDALLKDTTGVQLVAAYSGTIEPSQKIYGVGRSERDTRSQTIAVAGQTWHLIFARKAGQPNSWWTLARLTALMTLVGALGAAMAIRDRNDRLNALEELAQARIQHAEEKDVILHEMNHRLKNVIARTLSMARLTARAHTDKDAFMSDFSGRMEAMGRAQDALTRSEWSVVPLRVVIEEELAMFSGAQHDSMLIDGPEITLDERQVQAIGLVVHELATNASKYGAFAHDGRLSITWRIVDDSAAGRRLCLSWLESGLPSAPVIETEGFGSQLMKLMVAGQLRGKIDRRVTLDGVAIEIEFPVKVV